MTPGHSYSSGDLRQKEQKKDTPVVVRPNVYLGSSRVLMFKEGGGSPSLSSLLKSLLMTSRKRLWTSDTPNVPYFSSENSNMDTGPLFQLG